MIRDPEEACELVQTNWYIIYNALPNEALNLEETGRNYYK